MNIDKYILLFSKVYQTRKGKEYLNRCYEAIQFEKHINYLKGEIPKISVIIPVYNCEDSIKMAISSIQNQKLKEIEIILVNDYSQDNSRYIIENMQKKDSRIIIINNEKNKGTLYSRNIGAIYAKGKYIFALDNDDMFINDHLFSKIYNNAEKSDYDIIGFNAIYVNINNSGKREMYIDPFIREKKDKTIYQPNLKFFSLLNNDIHIWGKCIKNEIYKKAISLLGKERSTTYLCNAEDDVIVFMLFNSAKSFRFIPTFGIFHFISSKTASNTLSKNHLIFSKIFFLDLLFDFTENNFSEKKFVVDNAIVIKKYSLSKNLQFNKENKEYLNKVLEKIFICPYISIDNKKYIKNLFKR